MPPLLTLLAPVAARDWIEAKAFLERFTGVSHDALHVIVGVAVQLVLAALFRTSIARFWPWAVVLLAELANEWNDLRIERWPNLGEQLGEGAKDLALTMLLPTVLLLAVRFCPRLFRR
ncbi:hypothetical protein ACQKOE_00560 [Novosphingobium sp. NPDC080210]|uniref:hypothetical protein n=1 Tax=Novosphingobium sp. NPDC080210 TaxID=3390596 RepID=UPI003CFC050A